MTIDRVWVEASYDLGYVNGEWWVLRRGLDYYPSHVKSYPWKFYARAIDSDAARKMVDLLNARSVEGRLT